MRSPVRVFMEGKRGEGDEADHRRDRAQHIDEFDGCNPGVEQLAFQVDMMRNLRDRACVH